MNKFVAIFSRIFNNDKCQAGKKCKVTDELINHAIQQTDKMSQNARKVNEELKKMERMRLGH